ncbi:hypothetical protein IWQ61_005199, partial [Dispira simplex]
MPVLSAATAAGIALAGPAATALAALGYHYRERERDPSRGRVSDSAQVDKRSVGQTPGPHLDEESSMDVGRAGRRMHDFDQALADDSSHVTDFPPTSTQDILNRQQLNTREGDSLSDTKLREMLTPGVRSLFSTARNMANVAEDKYNLGSRNASADNTHWLAQRDMLPH